MKFIHISDIHLGIRPDIRFPWSDARAEEIKKTFVSLLKWCGTNQVDLILITGNLFHRKPLQKELEWVNQLFEQQSETKIVMIAGDCEELEEGDSYDTFEWAQNVYFIKSRAISSLYIKDLDAAVYGCSCYCDGLNDSNRCEHIEVDENGSFRFLLLNEEEEKMTPERRVQLAEAGFDYIALGRRHEPVLWKKAQMAYSGSLEPVCKSDAGKHGFILGTIDENEMTDLKLMVCASREYIGIKIRLQPDITQEQVEEHLKKRIEADGNRNIYRVQILGRYKPGFPVEKKRIYQLGNIVEVNDRSLPGYDLDALIQEHKDDVIGMYLEEMSKQTKGTKERKALYCGLQALLSQEGKT